ncbi:MAG TPA: enoyl-CoA hydratase/isomerase family protein [Microvirga sp.]
MPIHYEKQGSIATFTIDNGKVNVLTPAMHKELYQNLLDFIADPEIRVGIIAGAEGRSFCAGDDIKTPLPARSKREEMEAHLFPHMHEQDGQPGRPGWEHEIMLLRRYKPIVAAVDHYCLGQGLIYLLALSDLRIASDRAVFGFPEIAYGMGGAGGMVRLGRLLPSSEALWLLMTGEKVDAEEARRMHLINRVVAPEALMSTAQRVAETISSHPPVAVRVEMEAFQRCNDLTREDAIFYASNLFRLQRLGGSTDGIVPDFLTRRTAGRG